MAKRKTNHAKKFLGIVRSLLKAVEMETSLPDVWFYGSNRECLKKDCFRREDGLWEGKNKINTHSKDGGQRVVFLWRIAPNYCTYGQPCYSESDRTRLYNESETEKVLLVIDEYEFVWKWYCFSKSSPNRIIWGLKMGITYFEMRDKQTKEVLVRTNVKKHFVEAYDEIATGAFFENGNDE